MPTDRRDHALPTCQICGKTKSRAELVPAAMVRSPLAERIARAHPAWSAEGCICVADLNRLRRTTCSRCCRTRSEVTSLERAVVESLARHETLAANVETEFQRKLSLGERLADRIADFGGSWKFILSFNAFILVWVVINTVVLIVRPFDPYPFILLNLFLSCLAAVQAPVIMMSQNRQEARDRLRSENDDRVNLKTELEIRHLHEKLDHLLQHQWDRLMEIQQIQLELMSDLGPERRKGR